MMARVMVTGGAGFLGTPTVELFEQQGYDVFVPRSRDYDLRVRRDIARALEWGPDVVVHLAAAVGGIGANAAEPGRFFYDNALMGIQLMEMSRLVGVRKFVTVGTVCEYPENPPVPFSETDLWQGYPTPVTAPYGLAKKMLLVQAQAYRQQYGFNSIHVIPTNLYGPGDNFDLATGHVVPALIRKFLEAKLTNASTVTCWGSGNASREFILVSEAARAIVLATERYDGAEPVNIGSGIETPVRELAETVATLILYSGDIVWDSSKPDGQPRRVLDVSRAAAFGFKCGTSLEEGLRQTIEWYVQ